MCISFLSIVIALNTAFTQTLTLFEEYYVNDELLDCGEQMLSCVRLHSEAKDF